MDYEAARRIMVDSQIRPNEVTDPEIVHAFLTTPREAFVPNSKKSVAYAEFEIRTGDQRALWLPRDTAKMLYALDPKPSDICLVIGAGAGYECALLAQLTDTVLALEDNTEAVDRLTDRMGELEIDRVAAVEGTLTDGLPSQGPFDIILICGMIQSLPGAVSDQLADGGRLGAVVEMDSALGKARIYSRAGDVISHRDVFDCTPPKFSAFDTPRAFVF